MTEYERHMPPLHHHDRDWGASVRTIMQGLILAGVIWLATSVSQQNASIAGMQVQLADLKTTLDGVPAMKDRITILEQRQEDLMRRQNQDDQLREQARLAQNKTRGWAR